MDWMQILTTWWPLLAALLLCIVTFTLLPWLRRRRQAREVLPHLDETTLNDEVWPMPPPQRLRAKPPSSAATTPMEDAQSGERGS